MRLLVTRFVLNILALFTLMTLLLVPVIFSASLVQEERADIWCQSRRTSSSLQLKEEKPCFFFSVIEDGPNYQSFYDVAEITNPTEEPKTIFLNAKDDGYKVFFSQDQTARSLILGQGEKVTISIFYFGGERQFSFQIAAL